MKYPSDLTTKQWDMIKVHFGGENRGKHFQKHSKRKLVNAVLYIVKTGCQYRELPHDFPKYKTVSAFYQRAVKSGLWDKVLAAIVVKSRIDSGKTAEPSYGLIDLQSAKTTLASEQVGIDGGKKRRDESGTL